MDCWHKITKTWTSLSTRFKHHRKSSGRVGGAAQYSADCDGISAGLLKLRDDVQMCGYRDVQVMWNMLNVSLQHDQMPMEAARRSSNNAKFRKRGCSKQRSISRVLFWTNRDNLVNVQ
ncbi:hypothetical protein AAZX31_17G054100 [Glycine max]|uniref:Uncharacterized protein n=2 Tax=Glycine subgen. Soja TaxID=1462606 RepID=A0A0R0FHE5_SOYBN|nr:uncharacterized protein LOC102660830 [Glycine max]XP_028210351.1 uncharacterized protein LOC114393277 [Glycine soja]KAG4929610.1 hypothetical protein JHK86_046571 [Glycine max]KAG4942481.1 hypothetical protein JHK85_047127 [Glycine max]KAG5096824.1 hypothetical protein JHK82_046678 [Glycine max]KAG5101611.1 hypothetical protein JHK84_046580 [Glycine max]KAH1116938.1 hypothetical protein GYH30_046352 [Glycine max]|eukprot:XP_006600459.1 uncharacterized protein LOC102660830 [Glycine max]